MKKAKKMFLIHLKITRFIKNNKTNKMYQGYFEAKPNGLVDFIFILSSTIFPNKIRI